jgi:hypothetical protein
MTQAEKAKRERGAVRMAPATLNHPLRPGQLPCATSCE